MMRVSNPVEGITVYDDVFCLDDRTTLYEAMFNINYGIGWKDHFYGAEQFIHSYWGAKAWDDSSLGNLGPNHFLNCLRLSKPFAEFENRNLIKTVVNLTTSGDTNEQHSHPNEDVLLYYVNPEWKTEWQGETFFLDQLGKEVIYTSLYVPNRMIRFDGNIVHRFNTQNRSAPKFRFSISTFFQKEDEVVTDHESFPTGA
jgi:hypothetical protein